MLTEVLRLSIFIFHIFKFVIYVILCMLCYVCEDSETTTYIKHVDTP